MTKITQTIRVNHRVRLPDGRLGRVVHIRRRENGADVYSIDVGDKARLQECVGAFLTLDIVTTIREVSRELQDRIKEFEDLAVRVALDEMSAEQAGKGAGG